LVSRAAIEDAGARVTALVDAFHAQQPLSEGLPREEARARLFASVAPAIFEAVMHRLVAANAMVDRERLARPSHRAALPGGEASVGAVEAAYRHGGLTPPDLAGIAAQAGVTPSAAEAAGAYLARQKVLVRLDTLLIHRDALESVKRDIAGLKAAAGGGVVRLDVSQVKERYGISRKFAIPLLEYLDRERVTRRVGDQRVVL
ncbi:MAG: SelB C-terminal domain-containing protein, partial [Acidobacteriota bacterium]|nr:SelB C-terminal domain-containing protein [Acidobacteriota bacterium]